MTEQENKSVELEEQTHEPAAAPQANETESPVASELDKAKAALEEYKDKYLRTVAEFDNYKRRNAKERIEMMQTAGREVITELLEVLDDCERAQKTLESHPDAAPWVEGVLLVFTKFRQKLQTRGLKAMETLHQDFDADIHEALSEIPAPIEELKGKVLDEVVKGYLLNEKMIRHPRVVVGK